MSRANREKKTRRAWAKLNAYGVVLAALALLAVMDLFNPRGASIAILIGSVPPGQTVWVFGFIIAGLLMMHGMVRNDRLAESMGLVLLCLSLLFQTSVAVWLLGWNDDYVLTRFIISGLIVFLTWSRITIMWPKESLLIIIPSREGFKHD